MLDAAGHRLFRLNGQNVLVRLGALRVTAAAVGDVMAVAVCAHSEGGEAHSAQATGARTCRPYAMLYRPVISAARDGEHCDPQRHTHANKPHTSPRTVGACSFQQRSAVKLQCGGRVHSLRGSGVRDGGGCPAVGKQPSYLR